MALLDDLENLFPWLKSLGLPVSWFQETAASSASDAEVVAKLRQTSQYRARFSGITREDGSMRMSEAEYLNREQDYRTLLKQYGVSDSRLDNPADFVGFFDAEVDPNELKQRLDIWQNVKTSGADMKDAFYVYAGMRVSDDDLYAAVIDPAAAQRLDLEYNQKVASQQLDYATFITRATEAANARVAETLQGLQQAGVLTGQAVQTILRTDPEFARTMMDALYHGGDPVNGSTIGLQDLLSAYEYAAIGAAAKGAGLDLPDKERIMALREAGVTRAAAQKAYTDYGQNKNLYAGAVERATAGSRTFTQNDFEKAAFLGGVDATQLLEKGLRLEQALGKGQGQFSMGQSRTGRYTQSGLRS